MFTDIFRTYSFESVDSVIHSTVGLAVVI